MNRTEPLAELPKANILLVDDQPSNLLALESILHDLGQNLVMADSGEEALRRLLSEDFAVILLDVQMPFDGFETARLIRSRKRSRHTPIIFLTAFESPDFTPEQAYTLGAVDYLIKPVSPTVLRAKVAGFVDLYQLTEQVRLQAERLRESEERHRLLVEGVQDYAIVLLDPTGNVVSWNPGAQRIKGYRPEEIIGRHFSRFYTDEDVHAGEPERVLRVAAGSGRHESQGWRVRQDGSRFWADAITTALHGEGGRLRGFVKITRDLTERKMAEERARLLAQEQAARAEAEERVKARDRFLSIASHELRTPLNPLQLQVQMLLRSAREGTLFRQDPARAVAMLESCERQVKQFSKLVNDLLDISRLASGRLELHREDTDLAALAREVVARFGPELAQAGCPVHLAADGPAAGRWDRLRLDQVLTNLLSNALKYGGHKPIDVTVTAENGVARLTIRDQGIGIAREDQARIFERFERAVTGYEYGGLGLGLYIVHQLVQAHGGTIQVNSNPGEGATFTVELPCDPEPAAAGT